jgi:hypothetical protein
MWAGLSAILLSPKFRKLSLMLSLLLRRYVHASTAFTVIKHTHAVRAARIKCAAISSASPAAIPERRGRMAENSAHRTSANCTFLLLPHVLPR